MAAHTKYLKNFLVFIFIISFKKSDAQNTNFSDDISFVEQKIKTVYAGYADKVKSMEFENLLHQARSSDIKDSLAALSKLVLYFNDYHLSLFQIKRNKDIDTAVCKKNIENLYKNKPLKKSEYPAYYWVNDINNIVICLKQTKKESYEGYIVETTTSIPVGYCIIKLYKIGNKWVADYTDIKGQFRVFTKCSFIQNTTFVIGSYAKWRKVNNYTAGSLKSKPIFSDSPSVSFPDSVTVLIKMHDFSSKGVVRIYDSLINQYSKSISACKNLIIDIRNNAGGSIRCFTSLVPYICSKPIIRVPYYKLYSDDIIEDAVTTRKMFRDQNDSIKVRVYDSLINRMQRNKGKLVFNEADTILCKPVPSEIKNVALIINYGCRSAAELMILHLKQIEKVKTFGENTAGAIDYLDISSYRLPVSKLVFWVATTKRAATTKEPMYDYRGINPDVLLSEKNGDWVQYVKNYYE